MVNIQDYVLACFMGYQMKQAFNKYLKVLYKLNQNCTKEQMINDYLR